MRIVIMRGISGSGKSTYIRKNFPEALLCSADQYFMKNGEYRFNPSELGEAHASCIRLFTYYCSNPLNIMPNSATIAVDNTNLRIEEIAAYVQLAVAFGHEVEIYRLVYPVETAARRNVHGVPRKSVEAMDRRFQDLPSFWPKETIVNTSGRE